MLYRCFYITAKSAPVASQNKAFTDGRISQQVIHLLILILIYDKDMKVVSYFMICIGFVLKIKHIRTNLFQISGVLTPARN
jgi:hypothetical protein